MSAPAPRTCFVVMPFRADLNYFYLYVQRHLGERHGLQVERGDHRVLTIPLLEKIRAQIVQADVLIGDITSRNPNVFYELGMADAYSKPVILITQDATDEIPTDVRHLEFIRYDLSKHVEFLSKLDNAIHNVFVQRYSELFSEAQQLLLRCNRDTSATFEAASAEEFQARVMQGERLQGLPSANNTLARVEFLLPRIIRNTSDVAVMKTLTTWLRKQDDSMAS